MLAELKDVFDKMNRDRYAVGYEARDPWGKREA